MLQSLACSYSPGSRVLPHSLPSPSFQSGCYSSPHQCRAGYYSGKSQWGWVQKTGRRLSHRWFWFSCSGRALPLQKNWVLSTKDCSLEEFDAASTCSSPRGDSRSSSSGLHSALLVWPLESDTALLHSLWWGGTLGTLLPTRCCTPWRRTKTSFWTGSASPSTQASGSGGVIVGQYLRPNQSVFAGGRLLGWPRLFPSDWSQPWTGLRSLLNG